MSFALLCRIEYFEGKDICGYTQVCNGPSVAFNRIRQSYITGNEAEKKNLIKKGN